MPFDFQRLEIPDVVLVIPRRFGDDRGFFMETYKHSDFTQHGIGQPFVQTNFSRSSKGVLRGLHYQLNPQAQGKLVSVMAGEIFDVAVDIRRGSPTYGAWVAETLTATNRHLLYIPPGFAHGFCVLSERADVMYMVTAEYAPDLDRGIIWNDPDIAVTWPLSTPSLSGKDAGLPRLADAQNNLEFGSE